MSNLVRDAPFGQLVRYLSKNRFFQYPEEKSDYQIPDAYTAQHLEKKSTHHRTSTSRRSSTRGNVHPAQPYETGSAVEKLNDNESNVGVEPAENLETFENDVEKDVEKAADSSSTDEDDNIDRVATHSSSIHRVNTLPYTNERLEAEHEMALERTKSSPITPVRTADGLILADWYTSDDADNPQNWSQKKKFWTAFLIDMYTFVVYASSSIYISSSLLVMEHFGVGEFKASLGLALYVLGTILRILCTHWTLTSDRLWYRSAHFQSSLRRYALTLHLPNRHHS
jgi:DHA1 family multidrug resistance protein-like MFS transporter